MKDYVKHMAPIDDALDWGFYVNVVGCSHLSAGDGYPSQNLPSHYLHSGDSGRITNECQILYITNGCAQLETQNGIYQLTAGSIVLLVPGQWHRYSPDPRIGCAEYFVGFDGKMARQVLNNFQLSIDVQVIYIGVHHHIIECFHEIIENTRILHPGCQHVMSGLTMEILGLVMRHAKASINSNNPIETVIAHSRQFLHDNYQKEVYFEKLAKDYGLGYSYFRILFKRYTGRTPGQYLLQLRIAKAKDLIIHTDHSINDISTATGFASIYYFSRIFKEKVGKTPLELRYAVLASG